MNDGNRSPAGIQDLMEQIREFAAQRDWEQFHSPRNLLLALQGEVGELSEIFQWVGDSGITPEWLTENRDRIASEVADVLIYLLRFADVLELDALQCAQDKLELNIARYPVDKARGNSHKYTEFDNG